MGKHKLISVLACLIAVFESVLKLVNENELIS
jgi:hypothetical protein